ncbi:hypothetical protein TWF730_004595 [Orbilia blumenaviensis]|uniref:Uncharacterized protein n=1 Tax=Orbilia blumenaviensis TaxID=1796055 RepID=A0AAV9TZ62_9PEZI
MASSVTKAMARPSTTGAKPTTLQITSPPSPTKSLDPYISRLLSYPTDADGIWRATEGRTGTTVPYRFIVATIAIFLLIIIYALCWICVRREINPKDGSRKFRSKKGDRKKVEAEFRKRVFQMMKLREFKAEMEEIEREKKRLMEEGLGKLDRGIEEGKEGIRWAKMKGAMKMGEFEDEPTLFTAMRKRMTGNEGQKNEREKKREEKKATAEAKKKDKLEKKEAQKKRMEEEEEIRQKFKEEWEASVREVQETGRNRNRILSKRELTEGRRYVPRLY